MEIEIINPKNTKYIFCLTCKSKLRAELHSHEKEKWIIVRKREGSTCKNCRIKKILFHEQVDMLQPDSQLFSLVYDDPFKDSEKRKKNLEFQKEKRKEYLDKKYDKEFSKPWERKFVKDKVLKEDNLYGL